MIRNHLRLGFCLVALSLAINGQTSTKTSSTASSGLSATERELRDFYDDYRDDLVKQRREEIADRYDARGYFGLGNGRKELVTFEENKRRYLKEWTGPKAFEWRDLSYEILSPTAATVVGVGEWTAASGQKTVLSYTALLTKQAGQWRIRVEDESVNSSGMASKTISGDRNTPGIWRYTFTAQPGTSIAAHRHSSEMRITVKSGRKFILMGDLETAKVQRFEAGSTFVIPANAWHVEWWETETVEEIEITAPTRTERATPATPRVL
jgi:quercetin dioxygenase-like cupin family protein